VCSPKNPLPFETYICLAYKECVLLGQQIANETALVNANLAEANLLENDASTNLADATTNLADATTDVSEA